MQTWPIFLTNFNNLLKKYVKILTYIHTCIKKCLTRVYKKMRLESTGVKYLY